MVGVSVDECEASSRVAVPLQQKYNHETGVSDAIPSSSRGETGSQDNETAASSRTSGSDEEDENENDGSSKYPPIFDELIAACSPKLIQPGDEKIIEKLKTKFLKINTHFRYSEECQFLLEGFIKQINEAEKIYLIIFEMIQNFESYRAKQVPGRKADPARIKKLEDYLGKLSSTIKNLQEKEVDFNDEGTSDYILECKLKERFAKVYKELCKLVGASATERRPNITYNGTRFPEINRSIRKYVNKHKNEFPDYPTILWVVRSTNEEMGLHLPEETVSMLAKEAFEGVGMELKRIRIKDLSQTLGCHLTDAITDVSDDSGDPANVDLELAEKLTKNHAIAKQRMDEMVAVFAVEQEARNLEPVEVVGDANDSPSESESEDEEENEAAAESDKEVEELIKDGSPSNVSPSSTIPTSPKPERVNGNASQPEISNGEHLSSTLPQNKEEEKVVSTKSVCSQSPFVNGRPRILKRSMSPDGVSNPSPAKKRMPLKPVSDDDIIILD